MATNPYRNPFRDATITPARIDAGVDYCGTGPVYAIGKGVILQVGVPSHTSTFGSHLSSYRLTEGPAKGLVVFFAEHYNLIGSQHVGQRVTSDTKLWMMNGCIEIGWGTADGTNSKAWHDTPYQEGQLSRLGLNMSQFLDGLGAPAGLTLGRTPVGPLPGEYHNWAKPKVRVWYTVPGHKPFKSALLAGAFAGRKAAKQPDKTRTSVTTSPRSNELFCARQSSSPRSRPNTPTPSA